MQHAFFKKGVSLIEVVIAVGIISMATMYVAQAYGGFVTASAGNVAKVQATFLLDEGVEALKTMRGEKWSNIASTTDYVPYYLIWSTDKWRATTTPQIIDNVFYRTIVFESVNRDVLSYNILAATTSGVLDTGTKKATLQVSWWEKGATTTRSLTMYVFNLFSN